MTVRVSMLLKSRESLAFFRACFLPGRFKDFISNPVCVCMFEVQRCARSVESWSYKMWAAAVVVLLQIVLECNGGTESNHEHLRLAGKGGSCQFSRLEDECGRRIVVRSVLRALAKFRKASVTLVMCAGPSAWNNSDATLTDFHES